SRAIHQNCWMGCAGCAAVVITQAPFRAFVVCVKFPYLCSPLWDLFLSQVVAGRLPTGSNRLADHRIERRDAVEAADFLSEAVGAQQVAHAGTRADDAQLDAARVELFVQVMQRARTGEINEG